MSKNVYLVVTDLHCAMEKNNRVNYFGEILEAMQDILNIAEKYKNEGYCVNLIFLGDVFDAGVNNASDAMQMMEVFYFFCSSFNCVWSVVGNHEISYAKNNPFWFLVSRIEDDTLYNLNSYLQPRGLNSSVVVPDKIIDGNTVFYFNHYGTEPKIPTDGEVRVGLFHQNVGSNEICKMWGTFDNVEEASYIQPYNFVFFGHMHLAKGEYWLNEQHTCKGVWLGSIGRTKVDEVLDDSLDVNVPAVIVEDGKFTRVDDNYIHLMDRSSAIDLLKLEATNKSKALIEEFRKTSSVNYTGETLFNTIGGALSGTPLAFLFTFLNHTWDEVYREYEETLKCPMVENREE